MSQSILQHNSDVDVFIHTWFDPENLSTNSVIPGREGHRLDPNAIDKLIQYYNPKKIMVEKPKKWTRKYDFPDKVFTHAHTWALEVPSGLEVGKDYICDTTSSMFYSIMMGQLRIMVDQTQLELHRQLKFSPLFQKLHFQFD